VQGPLIDDGAVAKAQLHVQDAVAKGARVVTGGEVQQNRFMTPTVLADVTSDMLCSREETFANVAPVYKFTSEDEVVKAANDTEFGLASYVFTTNMARIFRVSEALEYGMVGVNTGLISDSVVPFGGVKQSGIGREGGREGIEEYVETKYVCIGGVALSEKQ
jgi:succinate-semialdehyde dehydrogenase/glutarate-semialdehyde dehydrogenase